MGLTSLEESLWLASRECMAIGPSIGRLFVVVLLLHSCLVAETVPKRESDVFVVHKVIDLNQVDGQFTDLRVLGSVCVVVE